MPKPHRRSRASGPEIDDLALPGIGQRPDLRAVDGYAVTVVLHHSRGRDLYVLEEDDQPRAALKLSEPYA